jgi:hypothetical protein
MASIRPACARLDLARGRLSGAHELMMLVNDENWSLLIRAALEFAPAYDPSLG